MDKAERETRDFMNVESFSQLPFIRPAPPVKEKGGGAIRLFGKDFGTAAEEDRTDSSENDNNDGETEAIKDGVNSDGTEISGRKFECHYCCRNFPTSQALGGHQNAHKRERQHAKRAHLQSAMVHGGLSDPHVYGLMNYNRFGSSMSTPTLPLAYHSWKNSSGSSHYSPNGSLYGGYGSYSTAHEPQPINGNPLAVWRISSANSSSGFSTRERSSQVHQQVPLFYKSRDDHLKPLYPSAGIGDSSQSRFRYESKSGIQDHVSLDLHL